jgi:hypothetical protein
MIKIERFRQVIALIFRRWWFLGLLFLPQLLPPYASNGYDLTEWGVVNAFIITHPIKIPFSHYFPIFQVIPLVLLVLAFVFKQKVARLLSVYAGIFFLLVAVLQSISVSKLFGTAICTANLVTFGLLGFLWLRDAVHPQNSLNLRKDAVLRYWPLVLALLAFWEPVNPRTLLPDFNPMYLFTSGSGLSFCMATPLYLAILILSFPGVNKTLMAATAFIGFYIGVSNLVLEFVINPTWWWIGFLHFPLVILSVYSLFLIFDEYLRNINIGW